MGNRNRSSNIAHLCRRAQVDLTIAWLCLVGLQVALQAWLG